MTNSGTTSRARCEPPVSSTEPSAPARQLLRALRWYQAARTGRVSPCRFYPSCSQYALEAVEGHGAARGGWLALRRVLRCNPFGPHGVDLVPAPRERGHR
jgi:putative membrane protein insertion efficiency factor